MISTRPGYLGNVRERPTECEGIRHRKRCVLEVLFTNLSIFFLFTSTLSSMERGGGGGGVGLKKRLREKGYCKKDILDLTGKRIRGVLLTKGDSRGLERTNLMDTGHC